MNTTNDLTAMALALNLFLVLGVATNSCGTTSEGNGGLPPVSNSDTIPDIPLADSTILTVNTVMSMYQRAWFEGYDCRDKNKSQRQQWYQDSILFANLYEYHLTND